MTMERRFLLLFVFVMVLALVVAGPSSAKVPPGAFITSPVSGPNALGDLIEKDKVTALRYSKHYGMSSNELSKYIKENLVLSTLPKTQTFTTYYVTKSGRIIEHTKTVKAGAVILSTPTGVPIIELRCGNPLGKVLPKVETKVKSSEQETPPAAQPTAPVEAAAQPPAQETLVASTPAEPAAPLPVQEAVLAEPPFELPVAPLTALSTGSSWLVPTLLGAGAVGALVGGGGSSPNVVPEPMSLMVLGMGTMALMAQCYKKRTR